MEPKLYTMYKKEVLPALVKDLGYDNVMQVPHLKKVVLNVGYGRKYKDKAFIDNVTETLTRISGQKPIHNNAKKSISNFKIREGMAVGVSVTLRGKAMYEFMYRLINVVLPRVRDFRGLNSKSFDGQGNYCLGIKENIAFPEIQVESLDKIHGLDICISTSANNREEGLQLLKKLGLPLKKIS